MTIDPDDDAGDHADGRDAEREVLPLREAELVEGVAEPRRGAVSALEADLDERTDHRVQPEERAEDHDGEDATRRRTGRLPIVTPSASWGPAELRGVLRLRDPGAEEQRREDDADQQARAARTTARGPPEPKRPPSA